LSVWFTSGYYIQLHAIHYKVSVLYIISNRIPYICVYCGVWTRCYAGTSWHIASGAVAMQLTNK
jgi:hypothetical protein